MIVFFFTLLWLCGFLISVALVHETEKLSGKNIFGMAIGWPVIGIFLLYILIKEVFKK